MRASTCRSRLVSITLVFGSALGLLAANVNAASPEDTLRPPRPCSLTIDKTCYIPPPPSDTFSCSKPIDSLSMIWNGPQQPGETVTVVAYKGDTGAEVVDTVSGIEVGDEVTIAGFAGSPNDVIWEIFDAAGNKLGESTFHLSCSDDDMDGAEDCGKAQGDGKGGTGFLNDWIFEGMVDSDETLDCTQAPPGPGDFRNFCEFASADGTECTQRPTEVSLRYNGGDCSQSMNTQDEGKWFCNDLGVPGEPVRIVITNGDKTYADVSDVGIGDVILATAAMAGRSDFDSEVFASIFDADGNVLQELKFHTSCSQPFVIGDRFGALELVGFVNAEQGVVQSGTNIIYAYKITNTGQTNIIDVIVRDLSLTPVEVPGSPIPFIPPGGMETLFAETFVDKSMNTLAYAWAETPAGQHCDAIDRLIVIERGPPPCVVDPTEFKISDDRIEWKLLNAGDRMATIESIAITWPVEYGAIDKVKFDGDIFVNDTRDPPMATFTVDDFVPDVNKRDFEPGQTKTLTFEFVGSYTGAIPDDFQITVNFEEGCSVTFVPGQVPWECTKPIDALTMIWNGSQAVEVEAWKGDVGSTSLGVQSAIPGQEITFSGFAGSPNDVFWEIFDTGGAKLGESSFHLSCSDSDMNGSEDCGKAQGDGKSNDPGLINDWILEGVIDAGGALECTP